MLNAEVIGDNMKRLIVLNRRFGQALPRRLRPLVGTCVLTELARSIFLSPGNAVAPALRPPPLHQQSHRLPSNTHSEIHSIVKSSEGPGIDIRDRNGAMPCQKFGQIFFFTPTTRDQRQVSHDQSCGMHYPRTQNPQHYIRYYRYGDGLT